MSRTTFYPAQKAVLVADGLQRIDVSRCPPDFRTAFQAHVNAWRQAQFAFGNNTFGNNFAEGVVAGISGDPGIISSSQRAAGAAGQDVNSTYYLLTEIAAKYGARIPRSVVE